MTGALPRIGITFRLAPELVTRLVAAFPGLEVAGPGLAPARFETADAQVLLGWPKPEFVRAAAGLKWLQLYASGADIVDFDDVGRRGIAVTNARGVGSPAIAEHVLAMMLHFNRRIDLAVAAQRDGKWIEKNTFDYPELSGQTLAVVGAGSIGSELARRAKGLGMKTAGINRSGRPADGFDRVASFASAGDVLRDADHVVAALPGGPDNTRLLGAAFFAALKPGVYFYNVGRGETVDEAALAAALDAGAVAGAGLDVTAQEPLPAGHHFWTRRNVLITHHKAMNSRHYWSRLTDFFALNLGRFIRGEPLLNLVTKGGSP